MDNLGVQVKLIRMTMVLNDSESKVSKATNKFKVEAGLRQGDQLWTCLFNLVLEGIICESRIKGNEIIYYQTCQYLIYVDDIRCCLCNKLFSIVVERC